MKKGFSSEVKRLDLANSVKQSTSDMESGVLYQLDSDKADEVRRERNLETISKSKLAQLAQELDIKASNRYGNNDSWEFYYNFYGEENWRSVPYAVQSLDLCMADLEYLDLLLPAVVRYLIKSGVPEEELNSCYENAYGDFTQNIITECYTKGKFESRSWSIKIRHV